MKSSGRLEFGQVPVLELPDGRTLAQSNSMLRYLGRNFGYYPEDDAITAWKIDSLIDATEDFRFRYYSAHFGDDEVSCAAAKVHLLEWLPNWLPTIEKRLASNSNSRHAVGEKQTIVDFSLASILLDILLNETNPYYSEI